LRRSTFLEELADLLDTFVELLLVDVLHVVGVLLLLPQPVLPVLLQLELLKLEEYWKDRLRKQQEDSNHM
jgi:hypothetical protein